MAHIPFRILKIASTEGIFKSPTNAVGGRENGFEKLLLCPNESLIFTERIHFPHPFTYFEAFLSVLESSEVLLKESLRNLCGHKWIFCWMRNS